MRDELSQAELEHHFYGDKPVVTAMFFDKDVLDPSASKQAGERVMKTALMIDLVCIKEDARIQRPARDQDKTEHREAWAEYLQEKESEQRFEEVGMLPDCEGISTVKSIREAKG